MPPERCQRLGDDSLDVGLRRDVAADQHRLRARRLDVGGHGSRRHRGSRCNAPPAGCPRRANARAAAAPMPVDAPVMSDDFVLEIRNHGALQKTTGVVAGRSGSTAPCPADEMRSSVSTTSERRLIGFLARPPARGDRLAIAAIAAGRGKLRRYASATRRDGAGLANGTGTTSRLWYLGVSASRGSTEMPRPEATMLRTVSSELVRVTCASARFSSGHDSSTWSRKQWPTLSRIVFSPASSAGLHRLALRPTCASPAPRPGTAPRRGTR